MKLETIAQNLATTSLHPVNQQQPALLYYKKSESDNSTLHLRLLGDFLLSYENELITSIDLQRMRSLLAYLALHHQAPQARSHLAFLLWPDSTDAQSLGNLRTLVHRLRHILPNADNLLCVERQALQWRPSIPWWLDVIAFEQAVAQAENAVTLHEERFALEKAAVLYQGDLLVSCYDEWILPERDRLRQVFLTVLERLVNVLEQEHDYQAAIRVAQRLLRYDPLREEIYCHLIYLYGMNGERTSALRVYHTCTTVLAQELGIDPSQTTRQMYERLIECSDAIDTEKVHKSTQTTYMPLSLQKMETHLVGRQHEWKQIQSVWQNVTTGRPQVLVLSGDAGIGKTRLAEELLRWVEHQGIPTATARCYVNESELAYSPIASWLKTELIQTALPSLADIWLTEIARLVPSIVTQRRNLPLPTPMTESWQQQHLFEALARAVLHNTRQPLVLFLDDIQWCGSETLTWLHYLLRFDTQARLLLVSTVRSDEVSSEHPLRSFLRALYRDQRVTEIELEPLSVFETAALAKQVGGRDISSSQATLLHRETEGNPLFVIEMLRVNSSTARLPLTVQSIIADRLARLSTNALDVISVASVIGRAFTFDVLAYASKLEEEVLVLGLEELWQRRIVQELGDHEYSFTHDKLREGAYTAMSSARRCLLQHRVSEYTVPRKLNTAEGVDKIYSHNKKAL